MAILLLAPAVTGTLLSLILAGVIWRFKLNDSWLVSFVTCVLTSIWCGMQLPWLLSNDLNLIILSNKIQYTVISIIPILWLRLCQIETGCNKRWFWFTPFLFIVPAVTLYFAYSFSPDNPNTLWLEIVINDRGVPTTEYGNWFWIHVLQCYTLVLTGSFFLYGHFSQSPHYRKQLIVACAFPIGLIALNFLFISQNWFISIDPTPLGFSIVLAVWLYFCLQRNMFSLAPVARTLAMDRISDCIFILDNNGLVVDYNTASADFLKNKSAIIGQPLCELVDDLPQLSPSTHREIIQSGVNKYFEVNVSAVEQQAETLSKANPQLKLVVTLRDITLRHSAQRMLIESRKELEQANKKLNQLANTDELTGLANRRFLLSRLDEEIARARRLSGTLGVLFIDLDYFKQINDAYGHAIGDQVLASVAKLMLNHRKGIDIAARYGGEEMVLVVTDADRGTVFSIAERLWKNIDEMLIEIQGHSPIRTSVSIGIALLEDSDLSGYDLISRADQALYFAKDQGRNRVCYQEDGELYNLFEGVPPTSEITN